MLLKHTTAKFWMLLPMLLALALGCECAPASEPEVDTRIHPGDDFFAYANGDWLAATEIPADSPRWNARHEINERTRVQVAALIGAAAGRESGRSCGSRRGLRCLPSHARQQGRRRAIRAAAGPPVLSRIRAQLARQISRRRAARAGCIERPRSGNSSHRNGQEPGRVVRGI